MTDLICRDGMTRVARSLVRAYRTGSDIAARTDMSLASLYGGLALANAGLGAVHGFAGPIGGMFPAPHGAVCAALLPQVMEVNFRALSERDPSSEKLQRMDEIAQILLRHPKAHAADGIAWLKNLSATLEIPRLGHYGMTYNGLPVVCEKAAAASSMKGNPIVLTPEELREIAERSW
jgi:alcohol dehydrogenase class IV